MSANVPPIFKDLLREEQDMLLEFADSIYFPVVKKAFALMVNSQIQELCKVRATDGEKKLLIEKAKLEGAQQMVKILDLL